MEIQSPISSRTSRAASTFEPSRAVSGLLAGRRRSDLFLFLTLFSFTLCLVFLLAIAGISIGFGLTLALFSVLIIIALVILWPTVGFFVALGCTLLIEQNPIPLIGYSSNTYVFSWPPALQGLPDRPIGFFMLFVLLVFVVHGLLKRQKSLQGGELLLPFLLFCVCVIWGIVHGLATGGDLKIIVNEVRSFWYLFLGYLLAYNLIRKKEHLRYFFWCVILCAGVKGLQATYIYLVMLGGNLAGHHEIMAHEESYFFISILLLTLVFSLHYKDRPQFYAVLLVLPFIFIALIANQRRTDYVALLVGTIVAWLLIFVAKPHARKFLLTILLVSVLLVGAYIAAFYNGQGGFSQPARAIVSIFHPDASEAASNLYRDIENYDLRYTVKLNPLGLGFGKPFLEPVLLPNILAGDPVYRYIPHNTIYWVWMRLGPIGYLALWYLLGSIIVRGCITARRLKDKYLQCVAIYIVGMVVMEIIVAFADYQLSFYRNVIYVGMLAGILMKLLTLDQKEKSQAAEASQTDARLLPQRGPGRSVSQ